MSIKGNSQELFVGKEDCNILSFWSKKKTITYSELSSIEYCYFKMLFGGGYLRFVKNSGEVVEFHFTHSENEKISRTVELIQENNSGLEITEHYISDLNFYQADWFMVLMLFICLPVGIFLLWYYKKRDTGTKIMLTSLFIFMYGLAIFAFWPRTYDHNITLKEYNQCVDGMNYQECVEIIGGEGEPLAEVNILDMNTSAYVWYGDNASGTNATMFFSNGELISKAQIGLK